MGIFDKLLELAVSPIKIVTKTVDKAINDDWDDVDIFSLGTKKILDSMGEEVSEINNKFGEK